jgi:hypothetical protein
MPRSRQSRHIATDRQYRKGAFSFPTLLPKHIDYRGLEALQEQNDREGRRLLEEALNGRFYTDEGLLYA